MADQIELQKIHHCLRIIENIKKQIGDEEAVCYVEKAMDLTRKWLNDKTDVSQKLYDLLDDEECSLTLYQESEKDECVIEVWNCIIDAVAYICRKIYEEQGVDYFPEPIEFVEGYAKVIEHRDEYDFTGPIHLYEKAGFSQIIEQNGVAVMRKLL